MSPECRTEPARSSLAVTTMAEPGSLLLEQWTVAVLPAPNSSSAPLMTSLALLQAVRSYLHFSQVFSQNVWCVQLLDHLFLSPVVRLVLSEQWPESVEHLRTDHNPWRGVRVQVCQTSRVPLLPDGRGWSRIRHSRVCPISSPHKGAAPGAVQQHPQPRQRGGGGGEAGRGRLSATLPLSEGLATHIGQSSSCSYRHGLPWSSHQV